MSALWAPYIWTDFKKKEKKKKSSEHNDTHTILPTHDPRKKKTNHKPSRPSYESYIDQITVLVETRVGKQTEAAGTRANGVYYQPIISQLI